MTSARMPGPRVLFALVAVVGALATLIASIGLPPTPAKAGGSYHWNNPENCFIKKINKARARNGLNRLKRDRQLGYVAKRHARKMASKGYMYEQAGLGEKITRWRTLGQNTGRGGKCRHLFKSFMASSPHAANILGDYRFVGVGARWKGHRLYVQQIFESKRNPGNIYHSP
jgi:hypothetical protein